MKERGIGKLVFHLDLSQPLYEQVLDQMRNFISNGEIGLGEKIPSVRDMAQALKVNPNTVMRAYQELDRDQLTEKRRGQGTFVTTERRHINRFRDAIASQVLGEFITKMQGLGYSSNEIKVLLQKSMEKSMDGSDQT